MTTYDDIWLSFINRCKTSDLVLPTATEQIHETIQNAIRLYNNRMQDNLAGDNESESFDRKLNGDEILLLSHYIRLIILENELIYFSTTYTPFTKELGARNVGTQQVRLEN